MRRSANRDLDSHRSGPDTMNRFPVVGTIQDDIIDASERGLAGPESHFGDCARHCEVGPDRCQADGNGEPPYEVPPYGLLKESRGGRSDHEGNRAHGEGTAQKARVHDSPRRILGMVNTFERCRHRAPSRGSLFLGEDSSDGPAVPSDERWSVVRGCDLVGVIPCGSSPECPGAGKDLRGYLVGLTCYLITIAGY